MTGLSPALDVVIPSYKGAGRLTTSLPGLLDQLLPDDRVIVVDDASPDDSVSVIQARFPLVEVISVQTNGGFAKTANRGLSQATAGLVALLNDDCTVEPGWRLAVAETFSTFPDAGSMACLVTDATGTSVDSAGLILRRGVVQRLWGQPVTSAQTPGWVMGPAGAAAVYRRSALEQTGDFDERLESYYEDADLGLRMANLGIRCRYVPAARVLHLGGASFEHYSSRHIRLCVRNQALILGRDLPLPVLAKLLPGFVLDQLRAGATFTLRKRQGRAWLRGLREFLHLAPEFWRQRRSHVPRRPHPGYAFSADDVG